MMVCVFGIGGLIFFYVLVLLSWNDSLCVWVLDLVIGYVVVILVFLGVVYWGWVFVDLDQCNYIGMLLFGIMFVMIGWLVVMLLVEFGLLMLIIGLVFVWGFEQMVFFEVLFIWYWYLCYLFIVVVVLVLVIVWVVVMMFMF